MKDKELRKAFKQLAIAVGVSTSFYYDGSISVWVNTSQVKHNTAKIRGFEDALYEKLTIKKHIDSKEPHVCRVCYKETKQK